MRARLYRHSYYAVAQALQQGKREAHLQTTSIPAPEIETGTRHPIPSESEISPGR